MVDERVAGVPVEQLVGWVTFCGLRILVDRGVFVPRRRTELLVRESVGLARRVDGPVVVDLCCGSGAVGAAIAAALPSVELHAVDIDPVAVRCASRNLAGAGASVYEGDLDAPLPITLAGRVDVLVANAPYVPSGEIGMLPREARVHEPRTALDGGTDGLDVLRRLAAAALRWLAPAATCWSRRVSGRPSRSQSSSPAIGCVRASHETTRWTPPSSSGCVRAYAPMSSSRLPSPFPYEERQGTDHAQADRDRVRHPQVYRLAA